MRNFYLFLVLLTAEASYGQNVYQNVNDSKVALDGYDVVAYFTENNAIKGQKAIQTSYNGVMYQFATEQNLKTFLNDPGSYLPQYGGYCAFGLGADPEKTGFTPRRYKPNPEAFIVLNKKLYMFYKTALFDSKAIFERVPEGVRQSIIHQADSLWQSIEKSYEGIVVPDELSPIAPPETLDMAFLVGEWQCDIQIKQQDGSYGQMTGKWIGQYSQDGRSIIDIWAEGMPTQGVNVRTYNPHTKKWNFTWTTANDEPWGALIGYREDDKMIFETIQYKVNGKNILNKITFYNITSDHFDYFINASYDDGESWIDKTTIISAKRVK